MNTPEAIVRRQSVRAFLPDPVSGEQVRQLLELASHAPSGANTQPWQVAVVTGAAKARVCAALKHAYETGVAPGKDFQYYPLEWRDPYRQRRFACGQQLYDALGIARDDKQRRRDQWARNYAGFDAPVLLFFFLDRVMQAGSYLDYGMFLQTLMLAAVDAGLSTCPQAALAEFPQVVRDELQYPDSMQLLCGMALGYADASAAVNGYRTPRQPASAFTRFYH